MTDLTPRQQSLTYLFSTAMEGGIGFFSYGLNYTWDAPYAEQGADLIPEQVEDAEDWIESFKAAKVPFRMVKIAVYGEEHTLPCVRLTPALMGTGLGRLAKDNPRRRTQCGGTYLALSMSLGKDDEEDYDSIDASTIAQFALGLTTPYEGHLSEIYG